MPDTLCHRCFQPLPPGVERCPECREYRGDLRRLPIVLSVAAVLALFGVLLAIVFYSRSQETRNTSTQQVGIVVTGSNCARVGS